MNSSEDLLHASANDGSIDASDWPRLLDTILSRLDHIVRSDFPQPTTPSSDSQHTPDTGAKPTVFPSSSQDSPSANKENAPPLASPSRPPIPIFSQPNAAQPDGGSTYSPQTLPADLLALQTSIRTGLSKNFPKYPPHTIQRLAELILRPKQHYRFLPSYLRALDRVVSVSSNTSIFPLPQAVLPANSGLLNGTSTTSASSAAANLSSDESLGGALLTPIPWLRPDRQGQGNRHGHGGQSELRSESTEMVEGPNGAGRIETVSVVNGVLTTTSTPSSSNNISPTSSHASEEFGGPAPSMEAALRDDGAVTQGELLRQEQEAGVVPVVYGLSGRPLSGLGHGGDAEGEEEHPEEHPHARGPEEIGSEDVGPQDQSRLGGELDMEAAVGRPLAKAEESEASHEGRGTESESTNTDNAGGDKEMVEVSGTGTEVDAAVGLDQAVKAEMEGKEEGESTGDGMPDMTLATS